MISAVITVYKSWGLAQDCVVKLKQHSAQLLTEIIIIDDCPTDPVPEQVKNNSEITLIKHSENVGYVSSVNEGFAKASGDIILLLDSDAFIATDLSVLKIHFDENIKLGLTGFKTLDINGNESGGVGPEPDFWFLLAGQQLDKTIKSFLPFLSQKKMVMHSHAFAVRKIMIIEIGMFDSDRFIFYEADNDFSMRVNDHPYWQLKQLRDFVVFHDGGSSPILTSKRVLHMYKSRWSLLEKFNRLPHPLLLKISCSSRLTIEWLLLAVFGRLHFSTAVWKDKMYSRKQLLSEIAKW